MSDEHWNEAYDNDGDRPFDDEETGDVSDSLNSLVMLAPEGATHFDNGPSINEWIRAKGDACHDYWESAEKRWITFEGSHHPVREHWIPLNA